ncbi:MAG: hypothetical protein JSU69_08445 [Candidatus Zixiibacteriota bacterium]|nr:MAG: hypothetical protein JSU69_08445 [candidate division Zixibacteria bacterium]
MSLFRPKIEHLIGFFICGLALAVRFVWLEADPPSFFSGTGQDLLTDPYSITYFARNKALFGSWNIFDYKLPIIYKYTLASISSFLFFALAGVSRITANLSAVALNLGGAFLFLVAMRRYGSRGLLIASILLLANMSLIVYGRYPFAENGLILLCAALLLVTLRHHASGWGPVLIGLLLALCTLSGKIFGVAMVAPVVLIILARDRERFLRQSALTLIFFLFSIILFAWIFYGGDFTVVFGYLTEQTAGVYGIPSALVWPLDLPVKLLTLGGDSRLFYFSPFLLLMLLASLFGLGLSRDQKERLRADKTLLFNIGWLISGAVCLMIFNYRPLRYQLFLILPMVGIIAAVLGWGVALEAARRIRIIRPAVVFLICWYGTTQISTIIVMLGYESYRLANLVWYMLIPSVILTWIIVTSRAFLLKALTYRHLLIVFLIILYLGNQSLWAVRWYGKKTYCLSEANVDLAQILGTEAVVAGPYAQALTADNRLKSLPYMFGYMRGKADILSNLPITHLAVDVSNWEAALQDYPMLRHSHKCTRYLLREVGVSIFRLSEEAVARTGVNYTPSAFEIAADSRKSPEHKDSAAHYLAKFLKRYPENKSGLRMLSSHYFARGNFAEGFEVYEKLNSLYPCDYALYFEEGMTCYLMYLKTQNRKMLAEAERFFKAAISLNPYIEKDIESAKEQAGGL